MQKPMFDPFRFSRPSGEWNQMRQRMIADAAYFRAQRRNFQYGHDVEDWLAAEMQVDMDLMRSRALRTR